MVPKRTQGFVFVPFFVFVFPLDPVGCGGQKFSTLGLSLRKCPRTAREGRLDARRVPGLELGVLSGANGRIPGHALASGFLGFLLLGFGWFIGEGKTLVLVLCLLVVFGWFPLFCFGWCMAVAEKKVPQMEPW